MELVAALARFVLAYALRKAPLVSCEHRAPPTP